MMETFFRYVQETEPLPWAIYSIIRCAYEVDDIFANVIIDDENSSSIVDFRILLLATEGKYATHAFRTHKSICLSSAIVQRIRLHLPLIECVSLNHYEAYVILSSYPLYLAQNIVKDFVHDFINFKYCANFFGILSQMTECQFSKTHIKHIFKRHLYRDVYSHFPHSIAERTVRFLLSANPTCSDDIVIRNKQLMNHTDFITSFVLTHPQYHVDDLFEAFLVGCGSQQNVFPLMYDFDVMCMRLYQESLVINVKRLDALASDDEVLCALQYPKPILNCLLCILFKIKDSSVLRVTNFYENLRLVLEQNVSGIQYRGLCYRSTASHIRRSKRKNSHEESSDIEVFGEDNRWDGCQD